MIAPKINRIPFNGPIRHDIKFAGWEHQERYLPGNGYKYYISSFAFICYLFCAN